MNYFDMKLVFVESVTQARKPKLNSGKNELKDLTQTASVEEGFIFNFEKVKSIVLRKMVLILKKLKGQSQLNCEP